MGKLSRKINLNLDDNATVLLKGFIAPIEDMNPNFHEEWDAL